MIKRNDKGALVVQLQGCLVRLGYALPRYGIDGDCGDETLAAMRLFLEQHGQAVDDHDYETVSAAEVELLIAVNQGVLEQKPTKGVIVDRLAQAAYAGRHLDMGARAWTEVTMLMLHHTACYLSNSKDIARCDAVGAHRAIYPDGRRFKLHPLNRKIVAGHGGNNRGVHYETDGNFRGVQSDDRTRWTPGGPAAELSDAQCEALKQQMREDVAEVAAHGGRVRYIMAHRQASRDRQGDPGSEIWSRVAVPMIAELGLSDGWPEFKAFEDGNGGTALPDVWTGEARGIRY